MSSVENTFIQSLSLIAPDLVVSDHQMEQFRLFYSNLVHWNQIMNLTTITEENDVYVKHFLDSLSLLSIVPRGTFSPGTRLIDIGTGAGFPGVPLAIIFPEIVVTLADSLGKRIQFLNDTIQKAGLENVTTVHARAEDLGRNPLYREKYGIAVSRAVAALSTLNEYCIPLLTMGGKMAAYKGEKVEEEINTGKKAARILGAELIQKESFLLPGTDYKRTLIVFEKRRHTPSMYPRKPGTPSRNPIR